MADTPNLHLTLGADADQNRNWQILDDVMHRLARGTTIADDVFIEGSLEVRNNTTLDGPVSAPAGITTGILTANDVVTTALHVGAGPVVLPNESITQAMLLRGATVQTAQTGTPGSPVTLSTTAQQLATLLLNPVDDPNCWQLVIAQVTMQIGLNADQGTPASNQVSLVLRRGGAMGQDMQSRSFPYTLTRAGFFTLPFTLVRITKPPTLDEARWSVTGLLQSIPGVASYQSQFAQMHVIQFR